MNRFKLNLETQTRGKGPVRLLPVNIWLAITVAATLCGCSTAEKKTAVAPGEERSAAASPAATEAQTGTFNIQDLSVREEAGQSVVLLNLSKPISRYRHFSLEQPGRIVLDIFDDV